MFGPCRDYRLFGDEPFLRPADPPNKIEQAYVINFAEVIEGGGSVGLMEGYVGQYYFGN
jgi:hypothetical protein